MPVVNPGIRRQVAGAITRLFNSASFAAPLTHTAVPQRAAPGTTATFTRATTSTWQNNDGYMVTGVAGEIGFVGARRIYNRVPNSETLTAAAGWWLSSITTPGSATAVAPDGTTTAWILTASGAPGQWYKQITGLVPSGSGLSHIWLRRNTGTGTVGLFTAAGAFAGDLAITSEWVQYSLKTTTTAGGTSYFGIQITTSGDKVEVWHPQFEDVTAQTTQTAGEYVSVGVESTPYYHGSFVDGVKCFPTDLSGNPIPSTTMLGYSAEGARTNLCTYSEQLDNAAWSTVSGVTVTANQYVAPDGATTMDRINVTAGNSTHFIGVGGITYTAAPYTLTMYLRYTNNRWAVIDINDAVTNHCASFDLLNGATGAVSAGVTSKIEPTSLGGVYRCHLTVTPAATGSGLVIVGANNTDTATLETWNAAGTETLGAWGAQVELGPFASSYIPTTTIAVARNADVLTYSSAGNIDGTKGWCYAEIVTNSQANHAFVGFDTSNQLMSQSNQRVSMYDGANQAVSTSTIMFGAQFKGAVTWGSDGVRATVNGEAPGSNASFDGNAVDGKANIYIGEWSDGSSSNFGTIRNVRIGQRQLSASELGAITS